MLRIPASLPPRLCAEDRAAVCCVLANGRVVREPGVTRPPAKAVCLPVVSPTDDTVGRVHVHQSVPVHTLLPVTTALVDAGDAIRQVAPANPPAVRIGLRHQGENLEP